MTDPLAHFAGEIPHNYDRYLGPAWFDSYAEDLARRTLAARPTDVLELACGTGILTRKLLATLPAARITATDLSQGMLEHAQDKVGLHERVAWRQADALALPLPDASFDLVICQYGWMFLPDKHKAAREARRVLRPGGQLLFNVWDSLACNDLPRIARGVLEEHFPGSAAPFFGLAFGCHDRAAVMEPAKAAGMQGVSVSEVGRQGATSPARDIAAGLIHGLPIRHALQSRGANLEELVDAVGAALAKELGDPPARARLQALVVAGRR